MGSREPRRLNPSLVAALSAGRLLMVLTLEALTSRLHSVHLDELERQMKVAVIVLNPTVLVFVQLVAP